ncbi:hypothetical protein D3C79_785640 [compost metagenome]
MGVGQADPTDVGLADMTDDHFALDRVTLHQVGHFRLAARRRVLEQAQAAPFIETDAPAVTVRAGAPAALHQAGEAEDDIGRDVGTHAQQFTHVRVSAYTRGSTRPPPAGAAGGGSLR